MSEPDRAAQLTPAYEALRAQATGEISALTPRGLALFLAAGLPAWIKAWAPLTPAARATAVVQANRDLSVGFGSEVVRLLTEMALGCQRSWAT
jgi:hypothetical protein